jgi:hypothetical protein
VKLTAQTDASNRSQAGGKAAQFEISEYCTAFEKKLGSFLQPRSLLTDDEAAKLGIKSEDDEVEKFVQVTIIRLQHLRLVAVG